MSIIEMPKRDDMPDAYKPKLITDVEHDGQLGWLAQLECAHVIWTAIHPLIGDTMICAVCLDQLIQESSDTLARFLSRPT